MLHFNYQSLFKHWEFAEKQVIAHAAEGVMSRPYEGIPIFPIRLQPHSAAERPDKDPRICSDLSSPQSDKDGAGRHSINAGIEWTNTTLFSSMRLTSYQSFARDVGILKTALSEASLPAIKLWVAKADWVAYYRQLFKPPSEYWAQAKWICVDLEVVCCDVKCLRAVEWICVMIWGLDSGVALTSCIK